MMKVLSLSDEVVQYIYGAQIQKIFPDIDLILGCGDLPYYYLEYVLSMLNVPLLFVHGNHASLPEISDEEEKTQPHGGINLHRKHYIHKGFLFAGIEGSLRYRKGPFMYTQGEMWWNVYSLIPGMMRNKIKYGRYLDVFVTHAPPFGIHDQDDLAHQGVKAFNWFLKVFTPRYHFHGHIHVYQANAITESLYLETRVINTFTHKVTTLSPGQ